MHHSVCTTAYAPQRRHHNVKEYEYFIITFSLFKKKSKREYNQPNSSNNVRINLYGGRNEIIIYYM
jgi:hypothetical protein